MFQTIIVMYRKKAAQATITEDSLHESVFLIDLKIFTLNEMDIFNFTPAITERYKSLLVSAVRLKVTVEDLVENTSVIKSNSSIMKPNFPCTHTPSNFGFSL